jgi:hypothetical protein
MKTTSKLSGYHKVPVPEAPIDLETRANGSAAPEANAAALSDAFVTATALPNIDGRPSVLTELPKDVFLVVRAEQMIPIFSLSSVQRRPPWTPAFAGMTEKSGYQMSKSYH